MPTPTITVDIGAVEKSFDALDARGHHLGQAFRVIKTEMRADQKAHASQQQGPDGSWPARAASTIKHLGRSKRKLLGRLTSAVTYKATADGVTAVSRAPWSGSHQEGDTVGHGAKLPARPFLWISDELAVRAILVIERVLLAAFGGR
jgi:phage gpG-like protein